MDLHDEQASSTAGRIVLLILACILALVLPFVVMRQIAPGPAPAAATTNNASLKATPSTGPRTASTTKSTASTAVAGGATATPASGPAAVAADVDTCRLANLRQQAPISAAEVSLAQFDKHIDAMNLLVAGKISLAVATTFWDQTRVGAAQNAAAFRSADKELTASDARCLAPDPAVAYNMPYGQLLEISGCANAIKARSAALARARAAVSTWEHHIHDMEMLRMGDITPAQATAAWRKNWHTGAGQLSTYEEVTAQADKVPCSLG
jgi:hypothetical protein